jgi:hypothetical protein
MVWAGQNEGCALRFTGIFNTHSPRVKLHMWKLIRCVITEPEVQHGNTFANELFRWTSPALHAANEFRYFIRASNSTTDLN